MTKSKRETDTAGAVSSSTVVDPWGGEAAAGWQRNSARQRRKYTTYERDAHNRDEAQHRQYSGWYARFAQPDPADSSYDLSDPRSLNRYSYVSNDPVNFVDPLGLNEEVVRIYTWTYSPWDDPLYWRFLFWSPDSSGGLAGGGGGSGAGGQGGTQNPPSQPQADPCAGKKGPLAYPFAGPASARVGVVGTHISDRHISLRMFRGKSKYVFEDISLHHDQSNAAMQQKAQSVEMRNNATFLNGIGTTQNNGNIAYVFAFPDAPAVPIIGLGPRAAVNGIDRPGGNVLTNLNTVIVKPDCQTVVTSFPGRPSSSNFPGGTYHTVGTEKTYPLSSPLNPGW